MIALIVTIPVIAGATAYASGAFSVDNKPSDLSFLNEAFKGEGGKRRKTRKTKRHNK